MNKEIIRVLRLFVSPNGGNKAVILNYTNLLSLPHKRTIAVYMCDSKVVYMISQMFPELVSIKKHQPVEKL